MVEKCEGNVRDHGRDEILESPLNKGLLLKNVRGDGKYYFLLSTKWGLQRRKTPKQKLLVKDSWEGAQR